MEEESSFALRAEMARLEAEEALVSAQRRNLHRQIDFGYATDETRARERQISDRRLELHRRIDAIRERLGMAPGPLAAVLARPDDESQGMSMERTFLNDADAEEKVDVDGHLLG